MSGSSEYTTENFQIPEDVKKAMHVLLQFMKEWDTKRFSSEFESVEVDGYDCGKCSIVVTRER